ncbi:MAG TPA: methylmalonyl Co-A mutase-associated GTPase MeaB [Gemmatimonadales bacterium]|nr:methylmalonyl Co-A mutase-associated GTPase MeaB [Gemmatimonadales bacterium]
MTVPAPLSLVLDGLDRGDTASLARAISLVENQRDGYERVLSHIHERAGRLGDRARRIGITGPPGAGKSTLTLLLIQQYRGAGLKVAVVAVDPTSPFSGGALLGDRIRMEAVSLDPGVFIRSMATRGSLGGLATTTEEVCDVLTAFGFERILIETVGVGQTELDVARTAETTALVLVPESGDAIQTLKAGVMEVADIFVVNKADRPGAEKLQRDIEVMLGIRRGSAFRHVSPHHGPSHGSAGHRGDAAGKSSQPVWEPPVLLTVASRGEGVVQLVEALDRHRGYLEASGLLERRRRERLAERTRAAVNRVLAHWVWEGTAAEALLAEALDDMAAGKRSPYEVAAAIVDHARTGAT